MARTTYQGGFIVAAAPRTALTPNFRAAEYTAPDGSIRVHRELVAAVQTLRDRSGALRIANVHPRGVPRGLGAVVAFADGTSSTGSAAAEALRAVGVFERAEPRRGGLLLSVDPTPRPLEPVFAFDAGLQVVADYETRGDPYRQVTGNFDGAGLSFGVIQFNLGSGTLQALFRRFRDADAAALAACFPSSGAYETLWRALDGPRRAAVRWGDGLSSGESKHRVVAPWSAAFGAVGGVAAFRDVQIAYAYEKYGQLMLTGVAFLEGLSGAYRGEEGGIAIRNHRCLTALFDMCIQQGGHGRAADEIRRRVHAERPADETALVHIAVEERALKATPAWRADCLSRRLGILYREPRQVTIEGTRARRTNRRLYLVRDTPVHDVERYLAPPLLRDVG